MSDDDPTTGGGTRTEDGPTTDGDATEGGPTADGGAVTDEEPAGAVVDRDGPFGLPRWATAVLPLVLLALVLGVFFATSPLAGVEGGEPLPDVTITHATLTEDRVTLHVVNNGPPVTVEQVLVDEAYWTFSVADGDNRLGTMESARIVIPYHWEPGWDFEVALVLSNGATFHHTVVAPAESPGFTIGTLGTLAILGVFVGVIPVALGMLWFPYIEGMSDRALHAVLAFSAGVLAFLAVDAGVEAVELAGEVPGAFEGPALVFLGAAGALLLVQSVGAWQEGTDADGGAFGLPRGLWVAYLVALGIGLHNLAEGLAIGSSFALGRVSLGTFLVVGFMVHNVTEGPAVVAPLAEERRPGWRHFVALGLLAGAPVILGGWIGGLAFSPTLGALFLAIGVGAILQVLVELAGVVRDDGGRVGSATNLLAFLVGLVVMYATDLLVVL